MYCLCSAKVVSINLFQCVTIHVHTGTTNNVLIVAVMNVSSPVDGQLQCTFLSGFNGSAHCTVQYGTDPTYMNLPYSAESTETGRAGDTVSVVLRGRLNSSTVYYYTVSAVSGDVTVTVREAFTTPQYSKYCSYTKSCSKSLRTTFFVTWQIWLSRSEIVGWEWPGNEIKQEHIRTGGLSKSM